MAETLRLHEWGVFHATRAHAQQIRAVVEAEPDRTTSIDFAGVEAITISFADELLAKLAASGRWLRLSNANEEVAETIETALRRRGLQEGWEWVAEGSTEP